MPLKVALLGQPVLREIATDVAPEEIATPEFQAFLQEMAETMVANSGVGLAAPQVFASRRVFLARIIPTQDPDELPGIEVFINPRLTPVSEERVSGWEGCLSFMELNVLVPRQRRVIVEYLDAAGAPKTLELSDFPARVVQHENDHLDGILTIDRAATTRDIVKASEMETVIEMRKKRAAEMEAITIDDAQ